MNTNEKHIIGIYIISILVLYMVGYGILLSAAGWRVTFSIFVINAAQNLVGYIKYGRH